MFGVQVATHAGAFVFECGLGGDVAGAFCLGLALRRGKDAAFVVGVGDPSADDEQDGCGERDHGDPHSAEGVGHLVVDYAVEGERYPSERCCRHRRGSDCCAARESHAHPPCHI